MTTIKTRFFGTPVQTEIPDLTSRDKAALVEFALQTLFRNALAGATQGNKERTVDEIDIDVATASVQSAIYRKNWMEE